MSEIVMHFDTETTGLDPKKSALIQISGIIEKDGVEVERFDFKVRPFKNDTIQPAALAVNGHKIEEIMQYPLPKVVYNKLEALFQKHIDRFAKGTDKNKVQMCAYNAQFDAGVLRAFYAKCEDKWFGARFFNVAWDSMSIAAAFVFGPAGVRKLKNQKLATVAEAIGIEVKEDKLHDSMYDVELHREIWRKVEGVMYSREQH